MWEVSDNKLLQHVFRKDHTILEELKSHRSGDVHRLLRRLDAVKKDNFKSDSSWTVPQVHNLLDALVKCYIDSADSIKLSRAVEKLWQPFLDGHQEYLNNCLEGHVLLVINTAGVDSLQVAKVSVLLEQNKLVQEMFRKNLTKVVLWVSSELSSLLKPSPDSLTPSQAQCLHALVKICLQLFQVCTDDLGIQIWEISDQQSQLNQSVSAVVKSLVYILQTQGYHTDCVLLSGTATALVLNSCKNTQLVVKSFYILLYQVLTADAPFKVELLKQPTDLVAEQQESLYNSLNSLHLTRLGPVALIRGMVACGKTDILFADSPESTIDSKTLFEQLYQYISILCKGDITLHYQAFQILLLWYTKLTKSTSTEENSNLSSTLESTLDLVVLNWDSPVEDVPEAVVDIFACMMTVWQSKKEGMLNFPSKILETLLRTQWYVKGRYRILAVLLGYLEPIKILVSNPEIQAELLQCLTTNHLASSATNVYRAFLVQLQGNTEGTEKWKQSWLPALTEGLVSDNSLLRYNTSLYWIPVTFKLFPETSTTVQDHLSVLMEDPKHPVDRVRLLHAWIIVAKTVRTQTGYTNLEHVNIQEALYCADEDVRSDAISLVCTTLKKAECISKVEVSLLMKCIPYNIKLDSAPFRQHLCSDIRKLLVRLRDSCTTLLKSWTENKEKLDCALDFVDWLHRLCIQFLLPGASYQRRKGSLDLLHVFYESLIYCEDSKQRKGFVPESTKKLLQFAISSKRWDVFNKVNTQALILCLLDGAEEIQKSAYMLLTRYYTMSMDESVKTPHSLCCHLLAESLRLCNSPKGHEGQSGAILCKLVFQKYVADSNIKFSIEANCNSTDVNVSVTQDASVNSAVVFIEMLLSEAKRFMLEADKDLVKASKQFPIHGLISAITQCLTSDIDNLWMTSADELLEVCEQLVKFCQQIIAKMLNIMAGVAGQEACPSFAEIGMALENLLAENQTDYEETTSLSPEYQYMLSWCWNNIKESCTSLGEVTRETISSGNPMAVSTVHSISASFHTVLTRCRHKGVIEGCRSAYVKFCSSLFLSNQQEVLSIPENALIEVLSCLKKRSISSSVTRRSAGLPIIIQAVLVSEKKMKKAFLLCEAVKSLFEICELPLDKDQGLTDLPQVHGLNILNSLFSDASLTASLIGHTSHAVILVIQQFGSPSWAVRNAATRFFSTLVTRIFGQKKSQGDKFCNSVTFKEFSSYYPDLPPFMLETLSEASKGDVMDISQIHAGLFPVLTLLSCLKPMETQDEDIRQLQQFTVLVQPFTGSPVYQLRHLVASALVAMVTVQEMTSSVILCLNNNVTPMQSSSHVSNNSLHGHLLYILGLLDFIERLEDQERLWNLLSRESWLISVNNGMVSSVYVKILHHLLLACPSVTCDEILEFVIVEHCTRGSKQMVGNSVYCEAAIEFLFESYNRNGLCMYGLVDKLLTFTNIEARKSCLEKLPKFLQKSGRNHTYNKMAVIAILCNFVKKDSQYFLCTVLNLITDLYQDIGTIHKDDLQNLLDWFSKVDREQLKCRESLLVSVLPVQAILIKHDLEIGSDNIRFGSTDISVFCKDINKFSTAVNENQRLSAVRALQIVGIQLLNQASTVTSSSWLTSVLGAILTLVQDEDTDIRLETCKFVSSLDWEEKPYQLFLQYLSDKFWQNKQCIEFLYSQLTPLVSLQTVLVDRESSRYQQLFDQEDNSFFAEKLYNAFDIHRYLKMTLKKCLNERKTDVLSEWINTLSVNGMVKDLEYLVSVLKSIHNGSVISICSDNLVLSSICAFLLSCDIVAMVTNKQTIQEALHNIVQIAVFPPVLRQKFQDCGVDTSVDAIVDTFHNS